MGGVTGGALALDHRLMGTAPILWQHILVAIVAELCRICDQQAFVRRGVRNVAAGTLPFFQEWVDITLLENFLKAFMTFEAGGPSGAGLELESVCRVGWWCDQEKKAHEAEKKKGCVPTHSLDVHCFSTRWQSIHALSAKGLCTSALKNFGSFEV